MEKKIAIVGQGAVGSSTLRKVGKKKAVKGFAVIEEVPTVLFSEIKIGKRFNHKHRSYKKISAYAAYRNGIGLHPFKSTTPVIEE